MSFIRVLTRKVVMSNNYDEQILTRLHSGIKESVYELAKENSCSIPQWVRDAIIEKIERDLGISFKR